jgi:tripartite ATP-independent transporter DctP family solute receptor
VHGVFTDQIGFKTVDALYPKKYPDRVQFVSRNLQPGAAMKTTWVRKAVWTAVMAVAAGGAWAQEKLRIAGNFAPDHSSSVAMQQFKKEVDAASKGTLVIEVFDNMQLGGAQENVTQTRAGTIHMTWVGMAFLSRTVPELEAVSLPFMFPSREVAYKVMDGAVGDLIESKMADKGFVSLGFMELGARQVTNSVRPIKTMADLKGLKIRMQPNETHLATFRALGANPLAMDIKEVYSALEQKVIDGHENPYALILTSRFNEVQKHLSNTGALLRLHLGGGEQEEVRLAVARAPQDRADGHDQCHQRATRDGHQGRRRGLGRAAEEGHDLHRDARERARADAQGHRGCGGRRAQARRRHAGGPGARGGQEGRRLSPQAA